MFKTLTSVINAQIAYFSRPGAVLARDWGGHCSYMDARGNKCAVGCLLTDEQYAELLSASEGQGIGEVWDKLVSGGIVANKRDIFNWLENTQELHDGRAESAADFVRILQERRKDRG